MRGSSRCRDWRDEGKERKELCIVPLVYIMPVYEMKGGEREDEERKIYCTGHGNCCF